MTRRTQGALLAGAAALALVPTARYGKYWVRSAGHGFGHGVGMSCTAATASPGTAHLRQIMHHYYGARTSATSRGRASRSSCRGGSAITFSKANAACGQAPAPALRLQVRGDRVRGRAPDGDRRAMTAAGRPRSPPGPDPRSRPGPTRTVDRPRRRLDRARQQGEPRGYNEGGVRARSSRAGRMPAPSRPRPWPARTFGLASIHKGQFDGLRRHRSQVTAGRARNADDQSMPSTRRGKIVKYTRRWR